MYLVIFIILFFFGIGFIYRFSNSKKIPPRGVVLITGASAGIGREIALYLCTKGYTVFAGVRTNEDGKQITNDAKPNNGGKLKYVLLDVTNSKQIDETYERVKEESGEEGLFCLFNNAAAPGGIGPSEFLDLKEWRATFDINLFGPIELVKKFIPLLRKNPHARIINNSSPAGMVALPFFGPYSCSKAAMTMFNAVIRNELKESNIRCILLLPAAIQSRMVGKMLPMFTDKIDENPKYNNNYTNVITMMKKFIKSTHNDKIVTPTAVAALSFYNILITASPNYCYTVGNAPPGFFSALPYSVQDWILTKL